MKFKLILFAIAIAFTTQSISAQTVDEILSNYYENTGGIDNWKAFKRSEDESLN